MITLFSAQETEAQKIERLEKELRDAKATIRQLEFSLGYLRERESKRSLISECRETRTGIERWKGISKWKNLTS